MNPQRAVVSLLASLSLGLSSYAAAGVATPVPTTTDAGAQGVWVKRIRDARGELASAHARYEKAVHAYSEMRHRRHERGEAKLAIIDEQEAARGAITQAARKLDALLEEARRAGVPPGWIREAMDDVPAGQPH